MNISQMMRSFLGEASSQDSRALELKVGQVVRGVILQVLENNEALVQINGVQVRAKLELPLQVGQGALLQVQPQSNGALVMLKQIEPGAVGLPDDTFKEWAKQLSLPEQKWAVEIVKDLRKEGVILNREVAQSFQQAAAAMPAGGDAEQWMGASAAAFKRGLPMTGTTVGAMQQVMFGKSAHELLDTLQTQLAAAAGGEREGSVNIKPVSQEAVRVLQLLAEGSELLRSVAAASEQPAASGGNAKQTAAVSVLGGQAIRTDAALNMNINSMQEADDDDLVTLQQQPARTDSSKNWIGQMMKWLGVDHELQLAKSAAVESQPQQAAQKAGQTEEHLQGNFAGRSAAAQPEGEALAGNNKGQAALAATGKLNSIEEQHPIRPQPLEARHIAERAVMTNASSMIASVDGGDHGVELPQSAQPVQPAHNTQQDSLKSALLSLIAADDTPPVIKETAQQLVQQITGQQLLLTPERNSSMLTHVTMFIPLNSQDGKQTASVHIQTRRGRKGELDSSNCRLLFNLSMNTIGNTMVDVNVTDKIVSLNLWNDHPAIAALADSSKSEIAESLQAVGYQLLSLRTTPLPKSGEHMLEEPVPTAAKIQQPPDLSQFTSTRYRGVDYRI
ncbi:hypothetical protein FHS15_000743 [Paenibacillus castaneae]|uniref:hypothetical protein n=1 Tax=Paenibacillus castaneae TaxID=474957 RepID=UPI000C9CB710|nr:hypothetical protein [Paenibacillus castaneae]NIK75643.1 hypothetical protein [Paenibacillus castaneae]